MATPEQTDELGHLLTIEIQDLFELIGRSETGAFPHDLMDRGLRLYTGAQTLLHQKVCGDEGIRDLVEASADNLTVASAVYDLIAGTTGHLPAASVAVLLVRGGVQNYCASVWD